MDTKNAIRSMTVQGVLVLGLLHFLPLVGVRPDESSVGSIAEDLLTAGALIWAIVGRFRASTTLTIKPVKSSPVLGILLLAVFIPFVLFTGCAGGPKVPETTIRMIGMDVGYAVYRLVPESRPVLSTICLLSDISDATLLQSRLKESLGQIWTSANSMTSTDSEMVVLGINNLIGTLDLYLANAKGSEEMLIVAKAAVAGICAGESKASGRT